MASASYAKEWSSASHARVYLPAEVVGQPRTERINIEVALAGRPDLKARVVWDLNWLLQKGVQVDVCMVAEKVERYGLGSLPDALQAALRRLHKPRAHERFRREMSRFLLPANARHVASERSVTQFFDTAEQFLQGIGTA